MLTNYRLGIDAGGTFTDFVFADKLGNTKTICRKSYISPILMNNYIKNPISFKRKKIINLL